MKALRANVRRVNGFTVQSIIESVAQFGDPNEQYQAAETLCNQARTEFRSTRASDNFYTDVVVISDLLKLHPRTFRRMIQRLPLTVSPDSLAEIMAVYPEVALYYIQNSEQRFMGFSEQFTTQVIERIKKTYQLKPASLKALLGLLKTPEEKARVFEDLIAIPGLIRKLSPEDLREFLITFSFPTHPQLLAKFIRKYPDMAGLFLRGNEEFFKELPEGYSEELIDSIREVPNLSIRTLPILFLFFEETIDKARTLNTLWNTPGLIQERDPGNYLIAAHSLNLNEEPEAFAEIALSLPEVAELFVLLGQNTIDIDEALPDPDKADETEEKKKEIEKENREAAALPQFSEDYIERVINRFKFSHQIKVESILILLTFYHEPVGKMRIIDELWSVPGLIKQSDRQEYDGLIKEISQKPDYHKILEIIDDMKKKDFEEGTIAIQVRQFITDNYLSFPVEQSIHLIEQIPVRYTRGSTARMILQSDRLQLSHPDIHRLTAFVEEAE